MKRHLIALLVVAFAIFVGVYPWREKAEATTPATLMHGQQAALALIRPCSHKGVTPVSLVAGANGATGTAGSTGAIPSGAFVMHCSVNSCLGQASTAAAAITASAKTTCNQVTANVPYWFLSESTDIIAVTGATGTAAGTCVVAECR